LVSRLDTEAAGLLVKAGSASLETRIDIFEKVGKWISIRNRLKEAEEEKGLLDAYRTRINAAQSEVAQREAERVKAINYERTAGHGVGKSPTYLGRKQRAAKGGTSDNGGAELEALISRLPSTDDGDPVGDRRSRRGETVAIRGANRLVRPDTIGNSDTLFDESSKFDEF